MGFQRYSDTFSSDNDSATYRVPVRLNLGGIVPVGYSIGSTWNSGTMTLYASYDEGGHYEAVTDGAWTANVADKLDMPMGAWFKFTLAGATSPDLTLDLCGFIEQVSAQPAGS